MFINDNRDKEDVGYITAFPAKPFNFPVSRPLEAKVYPYNGKYYFRTSDIAILLGVKNPFAFTADIKDILGDKVILKGAATEKFRGPDNGKRVTFIEGKELLNVLVSSDIHIKNHLIPGMYVQTVNALRELYG